MTIRDMLPEQDDPLGHVPPQDLAAEQSVLGACMLSQRAIDEVMDTGIKGRDFYRPAHETIWEVIRGLHDRREPVDAVTVADELVKRGDIARIGGPAYLHTLMSSPPTAANAGYYARIIRERATLRALVGAGQRITQMGLSRDGGDIDEIINAATVEVGKVADARMTSRPDTLHDVADRALELLEVGEKATPTPWRDLNDIIDGTRPSYLYATGARPGCGKTVFALQWAVAFARHHRTDLQVVYFTFEMTSERLYQRALATASGVSGRSMKRGTLTDRDWKALAEADGGLRELPLVFEGASGWTPQQVRARTRQLHRERPVGLVVVDHIGRTRPERARDSRQAELSEAADLFLTLAHEMDCSVHLLTQLNRLVTQRSDQRPVPSDVRDTDRIEQNADVLMLLHRDKDKAPDELHVAVAKNRDGEENAARLKFHGDQSKVTDWTWQPHHAAGVR